MERHIQQFLQPVFWVSRVKSSNARATSFGCTEEDDDDDGRDSPDEWGWSKEDNVESASKESGEAVGVIGCNHLET